MILIVLESQVSALTKFEKSNENTVRYAVVVKMQQIGINDSNETMLEK